LNNLFHKRWSTYHGELINSPYANIEFDKVHPEEECKRHAFNKVQEADFCACLKLCNNEFELEIKLVKTILIKQEAMQEAIQEAAQEMHTWTKTISTQNRMMW